MRLSIVKGQLCISFSLSKKILAVKGSFKIPLKNIKSVKTEKPKPTWKEIRAPGTSIPGLIKAGTYYTDTGKQFWFVTKGKGILNLELKNESYKRIVLGLDNNVHWAKKISDARYSKK